MTGRKRDSQNRPDFASYWLAIELAFADPLAVRTVLAFTDGQEFGSRYVDPRLMVATIVTLLPVAGFAFTQVEKPIQNYAWIPASIDGVVFASQIDVKWDIAQGKSCLFSHGFRTRVQ